MGSIRTLAGRGTLFFDFRFQGKRCREYTALQDTPANRKRLAKALAGIEAEIEAGTFDYAKVFPASQARVSDQPPAAMQLVSVASAPADQATPSFNDFVTTWLSEHEVEWRRSHVKVLKSTIDGHLLPEFGAKPVSRITKSAILAFRAKLADKPGRTGEKLSTKRINGIIGPLRQILADAAERYEFTSPCENVRPLKVRKSDVQPFTLNEVQQILLTTRADYKDYFTVRFFTGMRTGEVHGLKWKYVDFETRLILVRETFVLGEDEYTKTDSSQRDIQMSQPVFEALKRQHEATSKLSEYVFCNRNGEPLDNKNFSDRVWYPLLRHLGLKSRRPYQMRHTAATLWLASGEAPSWIAYQLGHSNSAMLFTVYARFVPNMTRQDGSAIDRLLASRFSSGEVQSAAPESSPPGPAKHRKPGDARPPPANEARLRHAG